SAATLFWTRQQQKRSRFIDYKRRAVPGNRNKIVRHNEKRFFNTLELFQSFSGIAKENISVIYGGDIDYTTQKGKFVSWKIFLI
ncbi:MAG: hypothetical protein LBH19_01635, partial [Dysgonamonadaceae bacterium]|nr:hypothetical protein [Dysgonamonadaceae bacterium]